MNESKKISATVIGATGLIGGKLTELLLAHKGVEKVQVLGRSSANKKHPKLTEHLGEVTNPDFFNDLKSTDVVYVCVGTTRSKTPDMNTYKKIDLGIPVNAAKWAKTSKADDFMVISAMGAKEDSKLFYNHIKGAMEEELKKLELNRLVILQPSLILGKRDEFRFGEKVGKIVFRIFGFLIPKKYRGIEADDIAKAMLNLSFKDHEKVLTLQSHEIKEHA